MADSFYLDKPARLIMGFVIWICLILSICQFRCEKQIETVSDTVYFYQQEKLNIESDPSTLLYPVSLLIGG